AERRRERAPEARAAADRGEEHAAPGVRVGPRDRERGGERRLAGAAFAADEGEGAHYHVPQSFPSPGGVETIGRGTFATCGSALPLTPSLREGGNCKGRRSKQELPEPLERLDADRLLGEHRQFEDG